MMVWVMFVGGDDGYSGDGRLVGVFSSAEAAKASRPDIEWRSVEQMAAEAPPGTTWDRSRTQDWHDRREQVAIYCQPVDE